MTISIARPNCSNLENASGAYRVDPADVWDVQRARPSRCSSSRVRTLDASDRKDDQYRQRASVDLTEGKQPVETHGENRAAAIMGALFGIALLVGSAFGGAFSGEEKGYVPTEFQNAVASANAR